MKNVFKLFGIIALVAVIGYTMVACPDPDEPGGGGSGGGDGSLGNTLTITDAQVYSYSSGQYVKFTETVSDLKYVDVFDSDGRSNLKPLNELIDGNPSVTLTNGKLNITLGNPKNSSLRNLNSDMPPGVTASTTNVKSFDIQTISNNSNTDQIFQGKPDGAQTGDVAYLYVDKDVNITGKYKLDETNEVNYAMNLKVGWNSIFSTINQTGENTYQQTFKTGTPPADYRWIIRSR
jgi:hypothetical protein